jgi:hypothetical protein
VLRVRELNMWSALVLLNWAGDAYSIRWSMTHWTKALLLGGLGKPCNPIGADDTAGVVDAMMVGTSIRTEDDWGGGGADRSPVLARYPSTRYETSMMPRHSGQWSSA